MLHIKKSRSKKVKRKSYFTNYNVIPQKINRSITSFFNNEKRKICKQQRKKKQYFFYPPLAQAKKYLFTHSNHMIVASKITDKDEERLENHPQINSLKITANLTQNSVKLVRTGDDTEQMIDKIGDSLKDINLHDDDFMEGDWSDWVLEPTQQTRLYSFLPVHLNKLLPVKPKKLVVEKCTQDLKACYLNNLQPRRRDNDVRPCKVRGKTQEMMLGKDSLDRMKVVND